MEGGYLCLFWFLILRTGNKIYINYQYNKNQSKEQPSLKNLEETYLEKKWGFNSQGFSLVSILVSTTIASILLTVIASLMTYQGKEAHSLIRKLETLNTENSILNAFSIPEVCLCHMEDFGGGNSVTVDTTMNPNQEKNFPLLRTSCQASSTANIIVEAGQPLRGVPGVKVDSIKLINLSPTGSEASYFGELLIQYNSADGRIIMPTRLGLNIIVDKEPNTQSLPVYSCFGGHIKSFNPDCEFHGYDTATDTRRTVIGCGGSIDGRGAGLTTFGHGAGIISTGADNTFVGASAGASNDNGEKNVFLGFQAGLVGGQESVAVGAETGGGSNNVLVGYKSGNLPTQSSVFIGQFAGLKGGEESVAIGLGQSNSVYQTKGVSIGHSRGARSQGEYNTLIGPDSYDNLDKGEFNTFVGYAAGVKNYQGDSNTFIGYNTGRMNTNGSENVFFGYSSGELNSSGNGNVFLGYLTGSTYTSPDYNVLIGYKAGLRVSGEDQVIIGYQSGSKLTSSDNNTFLGAQAGELNTGGKNNTFIGYSSGEKNSSGSDNTFVGHKSGEQQTTGYYNSFLGAYAGRDNEIGHRNTFIGCNAGLSNTGNDNNYIGFHAGENNTTGIYNNGIGSEAGNNNLSGGYNTLVGYKAAFANDGDGNVFLGREAGKNFDGNNSVFIGANVAPTISTSEGSIFIGHRAGSSGGDNRFVLGNMATPDWLSGDISPTGNLYINGFAASTTTPPSSRVLKKEILPFEDYEARLKDIIETPLYTYSYKKNFPQKSRMGIISEDLPEHFQLILEGQPPFPDWPSIYGSFWASIKALYKRLVEMKSKFEELKSKFEQNYSRFKKLQENFSAFKDKISFQIDHSLWDPFERLRQYIEFSSQNQNQLLEDSVSRLKKVENQLQGIHLRLEQLEANERDHEE